METSRIPINKKVSEIGLTYKYKTKAALRPKVSESQDAYDILIRYWDHGKIQFVEEFKILLLNRSGQILGIMDISQGGLSSTTVDIKLIFMAALKTNSTSIILAHNHPTGILKPSIADQQITRRINEAGKILEIKILDHLIVTTEGYYSFGDEGDL
jgi:DNA repair protein RadC